METFLPKEKKKRLFWLRTVGSMEASGNFNLTFVLLLLGEFPAMLQVCILITACPLGRATSNTESKCTVFFGLFPETLIQRVLIHEPLQVSVWARPFRLFQSFRLVLGSANTMFNLVSICLGTFPNKHWALLSFPKQVNAITHQTPQLVRLT